MVAEGKESPSDGTWFTEASVRGGTESWVLTSSWKHKAEKVEQRGEAINT